MVRCLLPEAPEPTEHDAMIRKRKDRREDGPLSAPGTGLLASLDGGADATRADLEALCDAVQGHPLHMHVGREDAIGAGRLALPATGVLVANVPPKRGALAANFTGSCHSLQRLSDPWRLEQGRPEGEDMPEL